MAETPETIRARLAPKQVDIDGETFWVAEGDLLLDADQLDIYVDQLNRAELARAMANAGGLGEAALAPARRELIAMTRNGKVVRWQDGLVLTYCVLRNTFLSQKEYLLARRSVQKAAQAWMDVCGIEFRHVTANDASPTTRVDDVTFTVRRIDAFGRFIASAFFPTDQPDRRRVLLDPSFFAKGLGFDRVGVLRHELGHVLGFRHEHISDIAPAECPDEDRTDTRPLTGYDPQSVMHYFCGGVGSTTLELTEKDVAGAVDLYGQPLSKYRFFPES
jgi:hypothetical protein